MNHCIEPPLAPALGTGAIARILLDVRNYPRIEDRLTIRLGIEPTIEIEIRTCQHQTRELSHPLSSLQAFRGSVPISGTFPFWRHKSLCFELYPAAKIGLYPLQGHHPPPREQPDQTGKRPSQPVWHRDNRCGPAGPGRMVLLIPSWLHFIMPPKHVAAQRTFGMSWFLLQIVCGHWRLLFDSDSVNIHGLEPVTTRIDGDDPSPDPAAPLHRA